MSTQTESRPGMAMVVALAGVLTIILAGVMVMLVMMVQHTTTSGGIECIGTIAPVTGDPLTDGITEGTRQACQD